MQAKWSFENPSHANRPSAVDLAVTAINQNVYRKHFMKRLTMLTVLAGSALAMPALAVNLVQNGGFESMTNGVGMIGYDGTNAEY